MTLTPLQHAIATRRAAGQSYAAIAAALCLSYDQVRRIGYLVERLAEEERLWRVRHGWEGR